MTHWYPPTPSRFSKRLADLEPPQFRLDTPHHRFTADLQRLNNYFWSTEISSRVPSSFEEVRCAMSDKGYHLTPELMLRAQIVKLVRNFLVHHRASQFDFPPDELKTKLKVLKTRSQGWVNAPKWPQQSSAAFLEMFETTEILSQQRDLPQLFFFAVRAIACLRQFGDMVLVVTEAKGGPIEA